MNLQPKLFDRQVGLDDPDGPNHLNDPDGFGDKDWSEHPDMSDDPKSQARPAWRGVSVRLVQVVWVVGSVGASSPSDPFGLLCLLGQFGLSDMSRSSSLPGSSYSSEQFGSSSTYRSSRP